MDQTSNKPLRKVTLFTAICIVIANMIGTGAFTSLGFQVIDIPSGFSLLLLWVVGGIFALCGALCYGELGAALPRSGGEYHYLSKIYHPIIGFLSGWVSVTVGFAAPIAAAAIAFGRYFSNVIPGTSEKLLAAVVVTAISLVHMRNLKCGSHFQNSFTIAKVLFILLFIVSGLFIAEPQAINFLPRPDDLGFVLSAPFAISFVYVTYSYSGWNASIYLAGEVKDPERNLPRSLIFGTAIVMVLYLLLNFVFLYTTPMSELAGELEVGYVAANHIFGNSGGQLMALLISFGLISSISSMVWAGPRVTQAIGQDIPFFRELARTNANGIPYVAIALQWLLVMCMIVAVSFQVVITYLGFTLVLSSFVTVLGVFVYRIKHPEVERPYKTWGYPVTPIVFLSLSIWVLAFILKDKPVESLAGLATIALGVLVYYFAADWKTAFAIPRKSGVE